MEITIQTAQNVNISYKPAGLVNRIGATVIDLSLLGGVYILLLIPLSAVPAWRTSNIAPLVLFIVLCFYQLFCEYFFNGRSLGKLTLNLRVVRLDGHKLTFWDCLLRWVLRLIDISASMGIVAMTSIIVSSKMQRLGDLAANTTVIREEKPVSLQHIHAYPTDNDTYSVTFPQVSMLSDRDVTIIKEVLQTVEKNKELKLLEPLAAKIKDITGIETQMNNLQFIHTVLSDYIHLTQ